jgi:indolepyruvate ferredoxin oxidoreductase
MRLLAGFKFLRGTVFNPFGWIAERRRERELIAEYERTVAHILERLDPERLDAAVALASIPEGIRGYGPVKVRSIAQAETMRKDVMASFDQGDAVKARTT